MNTRLTKYFVFTLSLIFELGVIKQLQAQTDYASKTFTTENGLPYNFVQDIAQDKTGFLWIATWNGISRYDGHEFKNYYHIPDDSTSFSFFVTDKILVDHTNTVWFLSQNRIITSYNRAADNFRQLKLNGTAYMISDIAIGQAKDLWLINADSLFNYKPDDHTAFSFNMVAESDNRKYNFRSSPQVVCDNTGGLWIFYLLKNEFNILKVNFVNQDTAQLQEFGTLKLEKFQSFTLHNSLGLFDIYISNSGSTWLFSKYGLYLLNPTEKEFFEFSGEVNPNEFSGKPFFTWFNDQTGINVIDTKMHTYFSIKPEIHSYIECAFIDKNNTIWSGNINKNHDKTGLIRSIKTPGMFRHYLTHQSELESNNLIFSMLKDRNDDIWAVPRGRNYIYRINPDGRIQKPNLTNHQTNNHLPQINSMVQDSTGLWFGCDENLIYHYNFLSGKFSMYDFSSKNDTDEPFRLGIHNILKSNNYLIINGEKGVYKYNTLNGSLTLEYTYGPNVAGFCMVGDGNKEYWIGINNNTVIRLSAQLKEIARYRIGTGLNNVENICIGDNNDVWIALMGGGLGYLDLNSGKTKAYTTADGLSNNTTHGILKDGKGNLWISTDQGISNFNRQTLKFRNFGKDDGLKLDEFNSDAAFKAPDGQMFFGAVGGMVSFWPDSIGSTEKSTVFSQLVITDFKISGANRRFQKAVYELDTLTFEKGENNFQFTFACLDFKDADKIKYRYRLFGENNNWIETDHLHRFVNYTNIKPGDYKLEIEATDINGNWNNAKSLNIHIPKFYYETLGFKLAAITLIAAIILAFIFMYIRQIELKAKQKQDKLRLESLGSQMNPHFIFNSLNSINYFISKNDKLSANHYIADFSRLIRSILSNMSSDYVPFSKELESINDYLKLEHLRFSDKFNYTLNAEAIRNPAEIYVAPGLVQPFIENAIWHGVRSLEDRIGSIRIEFSQPHPNTIQCIIEDDGIGRKRSEMTRNEMSGKKSYGIGIVTERIKIINQLRHANYQVNIEDLYLAQMETGTKVTIDLPEKLVRN